MVVFGFIANRLNVGITGLEAGSRHALHPEVERGGGDALHCGRGVRDLPRDRAVFPHFRGALAADAGPRKWKKRRRTQSRSDEAVAKTIRMGLAAKLAVSRDREHGGLLRAYSATSTCAWSARHSQDLVEQSADRVADVIVRSTHYEMLHNDRDALYNIIQELGSEPGIQRIRIFNREGRITYSTDARGDRHGGG